MSIQAVMLYTNMVNCVVEGSLINQDAQLVPFGFGRPRVLCRRRSQPAISIRLIQPLLLLWAFRVSLSIRCFFLRDLTSLGHTYIHLL